MADDRFGYHVAVRLLLCLADSDRAEVVLAILDGDDPPPALASELHCEIAVARGDPLSASDFLSLYADSRYNTLRVALAWRALIEDLDSLVLEVVESLSPGNRHRYNLLNTMADPKLRADMAASRLPPLPYVRSYLRAICRDELQR
jgi:hypothetical protein